ncbi:TIGR03084 family metal-binding protein [Frankia sp. QA3]|uniref:TIGR03084 family metal-binding protein n=1 Tax=Frankia sp. QA3 TaxID=710111 RepID=UPI000269BDFD|nr:TIGR03084 family metal-binding protein [Frankia sp. QA3]EIV92842.1 TIGR03084 family protein [Frankia sp. QA3]
MNAGGYLARILADLAEESAELDAIVARLGPAGWRTPTPAAGWTVAHQVAHLAWTDACALRAATGSGDPRTAVKITATATSAHGFTAFTGPAAVETAAAGADDPPEALLARWRRGRAALAAALAEVPVGAVLPWAGPPMSATTMATARLMETWAHGLDVRESFGAGPVATPRLRGIAHLGARTRDFAFRQRGLRPPAEEFRIELVGPGDQVWAWGPAGARQGVTGPALDFCLLVTRRRHRDDLALRCRGAQADQWLDIAQAFAGPPGPARAPGARHSNPTAKETSR